MRAPSLRTIAPLLACLACTGSSGLQRSDGGGDAPMSDATAPDAPKIATVAGNGAAIPPPDQQNNCGALAIAPLSCAPGAMCPDVECDCPTGKVMVYGGFRCEYGCISSVSCPVACAIGPDVMITAIMCIQNGLCASDASCPAGQTCIRVPGQPLGSCSTHSDGSDCLVDSDCTSGACVIESPSRRFCSERRENGSCNRDSHCQSGRCLFESADKYVGVCSDGTNGDLCFGAANDCKPGLRCLGNIYSQCSDGGNASVCGTADDCQAGLFCVANELSPTRSTCGGNACNVDGDCKSGFCVKDSLGNSSCSDGAVGMFCQAAAQCSSGFCVGGVCTTGQPGVACFHDGDCAAGRCDGDSIEVLAHCTDGKLGHGCRDTSQCEAGLHCSAPSGGLCVAN